VSQTPAAPHVPPQNIEAEESVLGAILMAETAIVAVQDIVRPDDFYRDTHGLIFDAAMHMYAKSTPVDALTMVDELDKRGHLEQVGGSARIHELAVMQPTSANAAHYARLVREASQLRGLIRAGESIARLGWDRPGEMENLLDRAEQQVFALTQDGLSADLATLQPVLLEVFDRMATLATSGNDVTGLATGFRSLDRLTLGLQPGNLVILAARPSMGKSALSVCISANVSIKQDLPVAMFSLEMSKAEVVERLLSIEANVGLSRVRTGARGGKDEWSHLVPAGDRLEKAPFYLDDSSLSMVELRSRARRLKTQVPELALIVVDYLGLLVRGKHEHKTAETGAVCRELKQLAKDLKVPVLTLCQLNRNVEMRADKRPVLSDLRDSGEIEQHADLVAFLYRDEVYNPDTEHAGVAEVIVAKHRNGPTDTVRLTWLKDRAKFSELAAVA
jgi:replicative DNA helicase